MSDESGGDGARLQPAGEATDLFGETPSPYRDPRGRPKMKLTNELRDRVAMLRASGMTQEEIADAVGCSVPTLVLFGIERGPFGQAGRDDRDGVAGGEGWQRHRDADLAGAE
jgi:hypothetical protein